MATVLIGGVFDPLHAGHLAYLHAAQEYGEVYAALTDSDKHLPLVPICERGLLLMGLGCRGVFLERDADAIRELRPRYYVKGEDWRGRLPSEECTACEECGTEIIYVSCRTNSSSLILQDYQQRLHQQAVREFEQFVSQQQPADKPWEPVTDYSLEGRRKAEGKHPQLIKEVFQPQRVLDVGCGSGYLVNWLRGLDIDAHGVDLDPPVGGQFHRMDITGERSGKWRVAVGKWFGMPQSDLVICREVLEHLTVKQIRQAVRNLVRLSSKHIYLTTRFNESPRHLLDIQGSDNLDPTHISLLPKELLRSWFIAEGCRSRPDLEARMDWQHKGRCLVFEV